MHTRAHALAAPVTGSGAPILRVARRWIVPEGFILIAALVLVNVPSAHAASVTVAPFLTRTVFAVALLLAWRFHRSRAVLAILLLVTTQLALGRLASGMAGNGGEMDAVLAAVAILLPVNLFGVAVLGERGTFTTAGMVRLAALAIEALLVVALAMPRLVVVADWVTRAFIPGPLSDLTSVPDPAIAAFAAAALLLAVELWLRDGGMARVFLWILLPCFLALHAMPDVTASAIYLGAAGVMLAVWVVEATYFMAYRDGLTELPGRRAFNEALGGLGYPYAVAMIDVDHFKRFNDEHGHHVGDQVLRMVAKHLERVGGGGQVYRYGGEEFAVVFPGRRRDDCLQHLRAIHRAVREAQFTLRNQSRPRRKPDRPRRSKAQGKVLAVTVSIGLAEPSERGTKPEQVVKSADQALYRAKKAGRDRIRR
jgi:diguanylate cyclase (GGDEF)-like protein